MDLDRCHCDVAVLMPKVTSHVKGRCTTKAYPYQTLPSPTSIRLLKVPSLTSSVPHSCEIDTFARFEMSMVTVDLDDSPKYTALSYTASSSSSHCILLLLTETLCQWGNPRVYHLKLEEIASKENLSCQCYTIEIDGLEISIPANLYAALMSIRYVKSAKRYSTHSNELQKNLEYIWIDALCINQSDLTEKSKQVLLMQRIYSQSADVLAWLGGSDTTARTALTILPQLEQIAKSTRDQDGKYPKF
jgi:hypothetical protein